MRAVVLIGWLCVVLVASGCTYSVRPILTETELVHDVDLNGVWQLEPDKDVGTAEKGGTVQLTGFDRNSSYDFQFGGTSAEPQDYVMRVGRIGGVTLAEFTQLDPSGPPIVRGLPVYVVTKLEFQNDTLTLRELDDRQCRKFLEEDKVPYFVHLGARKPDIEHTVMLATTEQIQEFLQRRHANVFTGKVRLLRRQPRPAD